MATSNLKVHAFDPGKTTGYATGIIEDGKMGVVSGQMAWNEFNLYQELKRSRPDIIVYESFEFRKKLQFGIDLFPRNLIGVINLYAQERKVEVTPLIGFYSQTAAQGKSGLFTDERLKSVNCYKVANPHANDAMRHLLYWYNYGAGYQYNEHGWEALA